MRDSSASLLTNFMNCYGKQLLSSLNGLSAIVAVSVSITRTPRGA